MHFSGKFVSLSQKLIILFYFFLLENLEPFQIQFKFMHVKRNFLRNLNVDK